MLINLYILCLLLIYIIIIIFILYIFKYHKDIFIHCVDLDLIFCIYYFITQSNHNCKLCIKNNTIQLDYDSYIHHLKPIIPLCKQIIQQYKCISNDIYLKELEKCIWLYEHCIYDYMSNDTVLYTKLSSFFNEVYPPNKDELYIHLESIDDIKSCLDHCMKVNQYLCKIPLHVNHIYLTRFIIDTQNALFNIQLKNIQYV